MTKLFSMKSLAFAGAAAFAVALAAAPQADAAGATKTAAIKCKAAPKIKAVLNVLALGPSIKLTSGSEELKTGSIDIGSQYRGFSLNGMDVQNLAQGTNSLIKTLKGIADFAIQPCYVGLPL